MPITFVNSGKIVCLDLLLDELILRVHLYQNDVDIDRDSEIGDFTECDYIGYSSQECLNWTDAVINAANKAESTADDCRFEMASSAVSNEIYGYYLTDQDDNLIAAEPLPSGMITFDEEGQFFDLTPRLTAKSEFNN